MTAGVPAVAAARPAAPRPAMPRCVILAAGKGSRMGTRGEPKPLRRLLGMTLLERSIRAARAAGLDDFLVVTGYRHREVEDFAARLAKRLGVTITCVYNHRWREENGHSVLAAREEVEGPFLMMMADHLVDPELVRRLLAHPPAGDELHLAVDENLENPLVDPADVTRVRLEGDGRIGDIGKGLDTCDAYDTGVFYTGETVFDAQERAIAAGDLTLSGAVRRLAAAGKARAVPVTGSFWVDVDDPRAYRRAREALLALAGGKASDGPVSRWLNRPLSLRLSRLLARTAVTPNQVTIAAFLLSLLAAALFAAGGYPALAAGGLLAQAASVIDGCDGELARLKLMGSERGAWLDAVLDRYADGLMIFGLTWHLTGGGGPPAAWLAGFAALIGSFVLSYTAGKHDQLLRRQVPGRQAAGFRMGRDVRLLVIAAGALLNQVLPALVLIAVLMNLAGLRRIWLYAHPEGAAA